MKRYLVIRFNRNDQPIAKADFATEQEAREAYREFCGFTGQTSGGVTLVCPQGFVMLRHEYGKKP